MTTTLGLAGVDLSHNNGDPDWPTLAQHVEFVWLKATEGTSFIDPTYADRRAAARRHGIITGAYHFARPANDPHTEAQHFAAVVGKIGPGELPPALDLEDAGGHGNAELDRWVAAFRVELAHRLGRDRFTLYAAPAFLDRLTAGERASWLVWLAHWESSLGRHDRAYAPAFWQHDAAGRVAGVPGQVDTDRYLGTRVQLHELAGRAPAPATNGGRKGAKTGVATLTVDTLIQGDHGPAVEAAQAILHQLGLYPGPMDAVYGVKTRDAVIELQHRRQLHHARPGVIDGPTWAALVHGRVS